MQSYAGFFLPRSLNRCEYVALQLKCPLSEKRCLMLKILTGFFISRFKWHINLVLLRNFIICYRGVCHVMTYLFLSLIIYSNLRFC